jgi:hypothetical protein
VPGWWLLVNVSCQKDFWWIRGSFKGLHAQTFPVSSSSCLLLLSCPYGNLLSTCDYLPTTFHAGYIWMGDCSKALVTDRILMHSSALKSAVCTTFPVHWDRPTQSTNIILSLPSSIPDQNKILYIYRNSQTYTLQPLKTMAAFTTKMLATLPTTTLCKNPRTKWIINTIKSHSIQFRVRLL